MEIRLTKLFGIYEKKERKIKNMMFQPYHLKSMHQDYLRIIHLNPGISQDGIAAQVYSDKANVARQISYLEDLGYVVRLTSKEDGRRSEVYLTDEGEKILKKTRRDLTRYNRKMIDGISEEDIDTFNRILNQIIENIEKMEEEPL